MSERFSQGQWDIQKSPDGPTLQFQSERTQRAERIIERRLALVNLIVTTIVPYFLEAFSERKLQLQGEPQPAILLPAELLKGFLQLSALVSIPNFNETFKPAGFRSKKEAYNYFLTIIGKLVVLAGYQRYGKLVEVLESDPGTLNQDIIIAIRVLTETSTINGFFPIKIPADFLDSDENQADQAEIPEV